jgi:hypothetical protein
MFDASNCGTGTLNGGSCEILCAKNLVFFASCFKCIPKPIVRFDRETFAKTDSGQPQRTADNERRLFIYAGVTPPYVRKNGRFLYINMIVLYINMIVLYINMIVLYINMIVLPRQTRDTHRENTQKGDPPTVSFSGAGRVCALLLGRPAAGHPPRQENGTFRAIYI